MRGFISAAFTSVLITGLASFLVFKLRSLRLRKHVLATQMLTLEDGTTYIYGYRHSFLNKKYYKLSIPEKPENVYIVKETTYYNYDVDIDINVFKGALLIYSMHLKRIFFEDNFKNEEVE